MWTARRTPHTPANTASTQRRPGSPWSREATSAVHPIPAKSSPHTVSTTLCRPATMPNAKVTAISATVTAAVHTRLSTNAPVAKPVTAPPSRGRTVVSASPPQCPRHAGTLLNERRQLAGSHHLWNDPNRGVGAVHGDRASILKRARSQPRATAPVLGGTRTNSHSANERGEVHKAAKSKKTCDNRTTAIRHGRPVTETCLRHAPAAQEPYGAATARTHGEPGAPSAAGTARTRNDIAMIRRMGDTTTWVISRQTRPWTPPKTRCSTTSPR